MEQGSEGSRWERAWPLETGKAAAALVIRLSTGVMLCATALAAAQMLPGVPEQAPTGELRHGRELLMAKHFGEARQVFEAYLKTHPGNVQAQLGIGDAQLGLHQNEAAEATYRQVTAQQPLNWQAHKNLVVVEAALHRWEEFDRERTVLRMARQRGAQGISKHESDVIDSFGAGGGHWVVRAYFEPVGRSQARYNFERFAENGRVEAYVSLEDATAAQTALKPEDVRIGKETGPAPANSNATVLALNWYTGRAHGTIRTYPSEEPPYQQLRTEVMRWIGAHPAQSGTGSEEKSSRSHTQAGGSSRGGVPRG